MPKKIPDTYTATFQLRPKTNDRAEVILASFAELMNRVERTLFADISTGKSAAECKSAYIKEHKITARQFNSIRVQLEGKISSLKEVQKERVKTLKGQISALESFLKIRSGFVSYPPRVFKQYNVQYSGGTSARCVVKCWRSFKALNDPETFMAAAESLRTFFKKHRLTKQKFRFSFFDPYSIFNEAG